MITGQGAISTPEETGLAITLGDLTVTDPDNTFPVGKDLYKGVQRISKESVTVDEYENTLSNT